MLFFPICRMLSLVLVIFGLFPTCATYAAPEKDVREISHKMFKKVFIVPFVGLQTDVEFVQKKYNTLQFWLHPPIKANKETLRSLLPKDVMLVSFRQEAQGTLVLLKTTYPIFHAYTQQTNLGLRVTVATPISEAQDQPKKQKSSTPAWDKKKKKTQKKSPAQQAKRSQKVLPKKTETHPLRHAIIQCDKGGNKKSPTVRLRAQQTGAFLPPVSIFYDQGWTWVVVKGNAFLEAGNMVPNQDFEIIPTKGAFVVRFKSPDEPEMTSYAKDDMLISLDPRNAPVAKGAPSLQIHPQNILSSDSKHFELPKHAAGLTIVRPPQQSHRFYVFPTELREHFSRLWSVGGVEVLPTLQGIVIKVSGESPNITLGDLIRMRLPQRAQDLPKVDGGPLFDFKAWAKLKGPPSDFRKKIRTLHKDGAKEARRDARMDFARFLLFRGRGEDALGQLAMIEAEYPHMASQPLFLGLRGLGCFLNRRYQVASRLFSDPRFGDDGVILSSAIMVKHGQRMRGIKEFCKKIDRFREYPLMLQGIIGLPIVEACLMEGLYARAQFILAAIPGGFLPPSSRAYFQSLHERLYHKRLPADRELYQKLTEDRDYFEGSAPRSTAQLGFAQMLDDHNQGNLSDEQLIHKLLDLHQTWRGDPLEFFVLKKLASLYVKTNDPDNALEIYETMVRHFPDFEGIGNVIETATHLYEKTILENPTKLSLFRKVALFRRHKEFFPKDKEQRYTLFSTLIQDLIQLDLLDQAMQILKPRIQLDDSSKVYHELAQRYLASLQPDEAAEAIKLGQKLSSQDVNERGWIVLQARVFQQKKQFSKALALITPPKTDEEKALIAQILWQQEKWDEVAQMARESLKGNPKQPEQIVKLALADFFRGEYEQIRVTRLAYGPFLSVDQQEALEVLDPPAPLPSDASILQLKQWSARMARSSNSAKKLIQEIEKMME